MSRSRFAGLARRPARAALEVTPPSPADFVTSTSMALWLHPRTIRQQGEALVWLDGSPERNHFVSARDAPTSGTAIDGKAGLAFDGTQKRVLRCGAFTGIGKGSEPCLFVIASINSDHPTGTPTLFYLAGRHSLLQASYQVLTASVGAVSGYVVKSVLGSGATASQASASAAGGYANGTPRLFMAVSSNASNRAEAWSGNVLKATAASGAAGGLFATPTHAVIGSGDEGGGATRWMDGEIWEAFMFANAPTAEEIADVLALYVAREWPTIYAGLG